MRMNQVIEKIRKERKLSQAELARRAGIQASHLNHFLRGKGDIRVSRLVRLLNELGIDLSECVLEQGSKITEIRSREESPEAVSVKWKKWPDVNRRAVKMLLKNLDKHIESENRFGNL